MIHFWKLLVFICLMTTPTMSQQKTSIEFLSSFKLPNISVRAIEVTQNNTLWFAGSKGRYGRIINEKLEIDSISHEGVYPEFRSIGFNGEFVFLLSIEDPALIYKIDPKGSLGQIELVYKEQHPKVFYDSLTFFDSENGIAMGDPTEDCLSVIQTSDGGAHWKKLSCDKLPEVREGEAAFAASNTNIATFGHNVWIVTGGTKARVFRSRDLGQNWEVSTTPMVQGGKMTGIFSSDFYDDQRGIVMGGNWEDKTNGEASKAVTNDGGISWNLLAQNEIPGYISCVQYAPEGDAKKIMAVSTEGMFYSEDAGISWTKIDSKGFYSLRFVNDQTAWVSTYEEIAKIKLHE
jgi:photosystem II stability/assembly factor-like uncharacterized protein